MKTSKCLMGALLSLVLIFGSVFAANTLSQDVINGLIDKKIQIEENNTIRLISSEIGNSNRDCTDCEFDFTPYGSECCDSAWDEFGINCSDLEANYNWDCSGCTCPGDEEGECGDGNCNINEDCETCEADCGVCGECDAGFVADCADNDCCPESWIGDGFADCEDQQYGCDLTCYDSDGGDCVDPSCGDGACNGDETYETCPEDCSAPGSECSEGFCDEGTYWDGFSCYDCGYCTDISDDSACDDPYDCCGMCGGTAEGTCGDPVCGDGFCTGDETFETCPDDCNAPGECEDGYITDCVDDDCCPESWIGDGFEDCEDQAYGCDLTCYDNDGGDCGGDTTGGTTGGSETCDDCEFDFTAYGSECCDTAADEFGISCADLEANYSWDCSGCNCPLDGDPVCGDGYCNGDEDYMTCPEDCNEPGECDEGYITDCADDDCCPESWIGDGFEDCEDQAYGCDLTCYDNDGGDCGPACPDGEVECWDGSCAASEADCPDQPDVQAPTGVCIDGTELYGYAAVIMTWDIETVCGDGSCNGDEDYMTCPEDCNEPGECDEGYITDCADDDCCPESWIGDGFEDCEDQAYGCDLTCYDNDGGDCDGGTTTGGTTGGSETCDDCEFDFTAYGSECCDTAADEFGISCADLEANYSWDCSGCNCPLDGDPVCGDGYCNGDEDYMTCPEDCNEPGECDEGYITDCADDDCCPESWIGDGFEDCEDQAYGCDLTCYDNDGGDCDGGTTTGGTTGGSETCTDCEFDFTAYGSECCDTAWDEFGIDCMSLEANYNWDCSGCNCPGDGDPVCGDGFCSGDETYENCPDDCLPPGECPDGQVLDCDGTDECWPESWIGDGFEDCEDQQYGADLTCYDNDGGDCGETTSCEDQGLIECMDGSCAETADDCAGCPDGTVDDCSGDGDCCFETWIGDGMYCDDGVQNGGACDLTCYDNDGGDCDDGGRTATTVRTYNKGETLGISQASTVVSNKVKANKQPIVNLASLPSKDGIILHDGSQVVRVDQMIKSSSNRLLEATVVLSCDACLYGGPWEGSWVTDAMAFGEFTVYGFDPDAVVCGTVTFCEGGACSDTSDEICAVSGAVDSGECAEDDGCDGAGSGDVNGDGNADVLDIVQIVNHILGNALEGCALEAADMNGDGSIDVLDIVQIVNGILGRNDVGDATHGKLIRSNDALHLEANGYIGGVQMTLSHGADFSIELGASSIGVAAYNTVGNETKLVIVAPAGEELFTHNGDFEIVDMIVANSAGRVNVGTPTAFSLSEAYPNPFNPTTSMTLAVPEAGNVSVQVYNIMGQVVATLASGHMDASTYTLTWDASNVSSGMYFVKAEAAGSVTTQKLVLMK